MSTNEKRCPRCGQVVDADVKVCDFCGANFENPQENDPFEANETFETNDPFETSDPFGYADDNTFANTDNQTYDQQDGYAAYEQYKGQNETAGSSETNDKKRTISTKLVSVLSTVLAVIVAFTTRYYFKRFLYGDRDKPEPAKKPAYTVEIPEIEIPKPVDNPTLKYSRAFGVVSNGVYTSSYRNLKFTPHPDWQMLTAEELGKENSAAMERNNESQSGSDNLGAVNDTSYLNYQMIAKSYADDGSYEGIVLIDIMAHDSLKDITAQEFAQDIYEDDENHITVADTVNIAGNDYYHVCVMSDADGSCFDSYLHKDEDLFYEIYIYCEPGFDYFKDEVLSCFEKYEPVETSDIQ